MSLVCIHPGDSVSGGPDSVDAMYNLLKERRDALEKKLLEKKAKKCKEKKKDCQQSDTVWDVSLNPCGILPGNIEIRLTVPPPPTVLEKMSSITRMPTGNQEAAMPDEALRNNSAFENVQDKSNVFTPSQAPKKKKKPRKMTWATAIASQSKSYHQRSTEYDQAANKNSELCSPDENMPTSQSAVKELLAKYNGEQSSQQRTCETRDDNPEYSTTRDEAKLPENLESRQPLAKPASILRHRIGPSPVEPETEIFKILLSMEDDPSDIQPKIQSAPLVAAQFKRKRGKSRGRRRGFRGPLSLFSNRLSKHAARHLGEGEKPLGKNNKLSKQAAKQLRENADNDIVGKNSTKKRFGSVDLTAKGPRKCLKTSAHQRSAVPKDKKAVHFGKRIEMSASDVRSEKRKRPAGKVNAVPSSLLQAQLQAPVTINDTFSGPTGPSNNGPTDLTPTGRPAPSTKSRPVPSPKVQAHEMTDQPILPVRNSFPIRERKEVGPSQADQKLPLGLAPVAVAYPIIPAEALGRPSTSNLETSEAVAFQRERFLCTSSQAGFTPASYHCSIDEVLRFRTEQPALPHAAFSDQESLPKDEQFYIVTKPKKRAKTSIWEHALGVLNGITDPVADSLTACFGNMTIETSKPILKPKPGIDLRDQRIIAWRPSEQEDNYTLPTVSSLGSPGPRGRSLD